MIQLGVALTLVTALILLPADAGTDGWVPVRVEYSTLLAALPTYGRWHFSASHGAGDLWTLNLSVSGSGFNPLTVLIADDAAYAAWCATNATTGCLLIARVNWTLNTQVPFPTPARGTSCCPIRSASACCTVLLSRSIS
jgi:hypothetical protein